MSETSLPLTPIARETSRSPGFLAGLARYAAVRLVILAVTGVVAVWLIIIIANLGGYVDEIIRADIRFGVGMSMYESLIGVPEEERTSIIEEAIFKAEEAAGLHTPFLLRTFGWLGDALTLRLVRGDESGAEVRETILDHLSRTLFVFGTANLLLFFVAIFLALLLTRRYGGRLDRLFIIFSPLSSAPAWIYGIILSVLAFKLFDFSVGGTFDAWPGEFRLAYLPAMIRHLTMPFLAIFLSGLFQGVYIWRTFFLVHSNEDSVEMARARGLPNGMVERRYILRPALPAVITSFGLLTVGLWQEVIALEYAFKVEGIGDLFLSALRSFRQTGMIVTITITFTYLILITVFLLDILYAIVDPRIRVRPSGGTAGVATRRRNWRGWLRGNIHRPYSGFSAFSDFTLPSLPRISLAALREGVRQLGQILREIVRQPAAVLGLTIILGLLAVSVYTPIALPYEQAIGMWRGEGGVWTRTPKRAYPAWVNLFRINDLPPTIIRDSQEGTAAKTVTPLSDEVTEILITFPFDYQYGAFPQELMLFVDANYEEKEPNLQLTWLTPDGREIDLGAFSVPTGTTYRFAHDEGLEVELGGQRPAVALFADPAAPERPLRGKYELQVSGLVFEEGADLDLELVVFGQVYGLAGTDTQRRDIMVALLWGTPVALSFGILAALATSLGGMTLAALGAWFGGWPDRVVQFLTEVNLVLPFFPVSLMIFILYSKSFWVILGVTVLLSIFGPALKTYRATFLQVKESAYIEAARAYGASDMRIIFRYVIPRIIAVMIPKLVILIPAYVFLETTLSFLGVSDPTLPTWGKLVDDALSYGIYADVYHLVLAPIALVMLTGFAFAMLGFALERILEPRLRQT